MIDYCRRRRPRQAAAGPCRIPGSDRAGISSDGHPAAGTVRGDVTVAGDAGRPAGADLPGRGARIRRRAPGRHPAGRGPQGDLGSYPGIRHRRPGRGGAEACRGLGRACRRRDVPQPVGEQRLAGRRPARRLGLVVVAADLAQVQVPALRAPVRALDPRSHDVRVTRRDHALCRQAVQARTYRALRQRGVADQSRHRRERPAAHNPRSVRPCLYRS